MRGKELQIEAFKRQVPSARLVLISHGTHYVFQSNEAEVLRNERFHRHASPGTVTL